MFVTISVTAGWIALEYFEKLAQKNLRERCSTKQLEMPVVVDVEEKKKGSLRRIDIEKLGSSEYS